MIAHKVLSTVIVYIQYEGYVDNLAEELAIKLDVSEDDINMTLAYVTKCGLIQIDNEQNASMLQAEAMVRQETNQASYMHNYRKEKQLEKETLTMLDECKTEKDIEKTRGAR
ncbi:UNVERIFIED_CONTAM: phage replisome organizer N-terminal domain-containing protein [Streptococcus canis]